MDQGAPKFPFGMIDGYSSPGGGWQMPGGANEIHSTTAECDEVNVLLVEFGKLAIVGESRVEDERGGN